jgi:predicted ester cyclase
VFIKTIILPTEQSFQIFNQDSQRRMDMLVSGPRKCGRVAECTGFENRHTARYREFESHHFRIDNLVSEPTHLPMEVVRLN